MLKIAEAEIEKMSKQMAIDEPILEKTQIQVAETQKDIAEKAVIAEEKEAVVGADKAVAEKK